MRKRNRLGFSGTYRTLVSFVWETQINVSDKTFSTVFKVDHTALSKPP